MAKACFFLFVIVEWLLYTTTSQASCCELLFAARLVCCLLSGCAGCGKLPDGGLPVKLSPINGSLCHQVGNSIDGFVDDLLELSKVLFG